MIKPVVLVSTAGFIRLFGFNESRAFHAEGAGRGKAVFDEYLYGYFVIRGCLRFNGGYLGAGDDGIQFSHTIEEQIGGQLAAGLRLNDVYGDTNGTGNLYEHNIPTYWATRAVKD